MSAAKLGTLILEAIDAARDAAYESGRYTHSEVSDRTALDQALARAHATQSAVWTRLLDVAPEEYGGEELANLVPKRGRA